MTDREKVIKGLECCLNADVNDCEMDCPYFNDCGGFYSNNTALIADALALLKAQEPRVMTLDELQALQRQDVVWLEDANKEAIIPGIVITALKKEWQFMTFTGYSGLFCVSCVDYGKRWRCWTSRPTEEQREAIPWNE